MPVHRYPSLADVSVAVVRAAYRLMRGRRCMWCLRTRTLMTNLRCRFIGTSLLFTDRGYVRTRGRRELGLRMATSSATGGRGACG